VFETLGDAAARFPAETREGFRAKVRILERQAQGLPADEIIEETGALRRLAASALQDVLELYGADYAEPDSVRRQAAFD
jgi:hypothetical protein